MTDNKKPSTPETLIKSTSVEISEQSLDKATGGVRKAGDKPLEYLKITETTTPSGGN